MHKYGQYVDALPLSVAARSKVWVCDGSFIGSASSNCGLESRLGCDCLSPGSVLCCNIEVFASGCSLVQRSPTGCGVSESECEVSVMKTPGPTRGCCAMRENDVHSAGETRTSSVINILFDRIMAFFTYFNTAYWLNVPTFRRDRIAPNYV
jgi:hypothetical protein